MEEYILSLINYVSIDTILISFMIFAITMVIKIPIKKITSNFIEIKRKAINSIIILIPIILSILLNLIYSIIFSNTWLTFELIKNIMNSWIISLSIYAIFERSKIIVTAFLKNNLSEEQLNNFENEIQNEMKQLIESIKTHQQLLEKTKEKIMCLNNFKKESESKGKNVNITNIFKTNLELELLTQKELTLQKEINIMQERLKNINKEEI